MAPRTPTVGFDDIYLNLEPLLKKFIEPISEEVRKITGPFKPIIDTLTAPIPVVSDLAALVGQPPVTLLGLMEVISGNDLSLIQSMAAFISFINDPKVAQGYIPLGGLGAGSFKVDPARSALCAEPGRRRQAGQAGGGQCLVAVRRDTDDRRPAARPAATSVARRRTPRLCRQRPSCPARSACPG